MGYEVLDSTGAASGRPDDEPPAAMDVIARDAPPTITSTNTTTRRPPIGVVALVVAALVLGAGTGGLAVRRYDEVQQRQARQSVLIADAQLLNSRPPKVTGATTATLSARLTNHGPLPITIVTAAGAMPAGITAEVVNASHDASSTAGLEVAPGASRLVSLTVPMLCNRPQDDQDVLLAVRTADRRVRQIAVGTDLGGRLTVRAAGCDAGRIGQSRVTLVGPVSRPSLRLTNLSNQDVRFSIPPVAGFADFPEDRIVKSSTLPPLPVTVRGGTSLDVRLTISAVRCRHDISALRNGIRLPVTAISADYGLASTNVDIAALVGSAVARACAKR